MSRDSTLHGGSRGKVISIIWFVAAILVLFTVENIWIDPWLRSKSHHVPRLTPEALSGLWFLALLGVTVFSILLIVAQVLVALDRGIPLRKRVGTGVATISAILLCILWARATSGNSSAATSQQSSKAHSVTLTWNASKSPAKGYNVYRGTESGGPYAKINPDLVQGFSYQDRDVKSGTTYYYVTRAVDAKGRESVNSSEIMAKIP